MLAAVYGVRTETMATNLLGGFTQEQIEAIRIALGVPPKGQMGVEKEFDLNNPGPVQPPPGGWPTLPCVLHRLNAKNVQESKIVKTAHDRDKHLAEGWSKTPQMPVEVNTDPPLPASVRQHAKQVDKVAKKKKGEEQEYVEGDPEDAA